jgi:hypothetical protein
VRRGFSGGASASRKWDSLFSTFYFLLFTFYFLLFAFCFLLFTFSFSLAANVRAYFFVPVIVVCLVPFTLLNYLKLRYYFTAISPSILGSTWYFPPRPYIILTRAPENTPFGGAHLLSLLATLH